MIAYRQKKEGGSKMTEQEQRGNRTFFMAAAHYVDRIAGPVYDELDFANKTVVLGRLYKCHQATNPRLLQAAYQRLEKKLVA